MKTIISAVFTIICLQSCAQNKVEHIPLQPKSIYQATKDEIHQTAEKYGLKGKLKSVTQRTVYLPKDSVIDISKYEVFDRNEEADYPMLAEMDNDCTVDFDKNGNVIKRKSFGKRFGSESINIDALIYDRKGELSVIRSRLSGDDFDFAGDTKFEYNSAGHLVKQQYHKQIWLYSYFDDKNQVRTQHTEDGEFRFDNTYTYNQYGQKIESQRYNEDGSLENRVQFEYDHLGDVSKEIWHSKSGEKNEVFKRKYDKSVKVYKQFDQQQNCIVYIIINPKDGIMVKKMKFEYY
ncbi:hypothetical protein [Pedobacter agri]|uniref:hypothetical protein n=1 Tax=Pedobacter agri TaxID=454586 RepID=UPI00292DFD05|nr:hypothetical protein [Pedobacter agri]